MKNFQCIDVFSEIDFTGFLMKSVPVWLIENPHSISWSIEGLKIGVFLKNILYHNNNFKMSFH